MTNVNVPRLQETQRVAHAAKHLLKGNLGKIDYFVAIAIDKLYKVALGLEHLCQHLDQKPDLEFPIGILLRSVMMDDLMVLEIVNAVDEVARNVNNNTDDVKTAVEKLCNIYNSDGTTQLVKQIKEHPALDDDTKQKLIKQFVATFSDMVSYDEATERVRKQPDYGVNLTAINERLKDATIARRQHVYDLYTFYSQYDHLSHWTAARQSIDLAQRLHKVEFGVIFLMMHLRDLLAIAHDLGNSGAVLLPILADYNDYLSKEVIKMQP